jgi:hypothetical protein
LDSANTAADLPLGFAGHFELGEGLEGSTWNLLGLLDFLQNWKWDDLFQLPRNV